MSVLEGRSLRSVVIMSDTPTLTLDHILLDVGMGGKNGEDGFLDLLLDKMGIWGLQLMLRWWWMV